MCCPFIIKVFEALTLSDIFYLFEMVCVCVSCGSVNVKPGHCNLSQCPVKHLTPSPH